MTIIYFSFLEVHLESFLGLLSQAWWLKTTEICSLTVLGIIILKSRCQQGSAVSDAQGRVLLGPSFSFWRPFSFWLCYQRQAWLLISQGAKY